jgi:uncharacterized protein YjbI with pentapeptide repeats
MYLKSVSGKILFEGRFTNVCKGVEMAVADNCNLEGINLRQVNLSGGDLDGANMPGACLWGANLNGTDLSGANLKAADIRTANLPDSCLAESDCSGADFSGAYFSRTIVRDADLSNTRFSCPSLFTLDLAEARTLAGAVYCHRGEVDCDLSHAPLIIRGLSRPLVFMDDAVLVGQECRKMALRQVIYEGLSRTISSRHLLQ